MKRLRRMTTLLGVCLVAGIVVGGCTPAASVGGSGSLRGGGSVAAEGSAAGSLSQASGPHDAIDAGAIAALDTLLATPMQAAQRAWDSSQEARLRSQLGIVEDYRDEFVHGEKGSEHQRYIVLHDTESLGSASSIVEFWDNNNRGIAAHFVIAQDGSVVQCVPLDKIAHHAGFGDTGHNEFFGTTDESRDDKVGTTPIGSWARDYGMNSYSVGIELVHVGGQGGYPEAQLEALDRLIALIDAHYGFESEIIDHKAWRSGNSDTSPEFAVYLKNYQSSRTHNGVGE